VDVIQPDVSRAGGLSECRRIAALAARHKRLCVFHAWKSGILLSATLRLAATVPHIPLAEYTVSESPLRRELVHSDIRLDNGYAIIPDTPGLGIELNEDVVRRYRTDL
jgi:L-alanine-DL-glutamate epimerase-like enolase superfamily enzyme